MTTTAMHPRALRQTRHAEPPSDTTARRRWITPATLYFLGALAVLNAVFGAHHRLGLGDSEEVRTLANVLGVVAHLLPGAAFTLLGPLQFSSRIRQRWPRWHRGSGRVFVVCGTLAGLSALFMAESTFEYGGYLLYSANMVFGAALLVTLAFAMSAILQGEVARHRRWMVRAFAIGLAAGTSRLYFLPQFLLFEDVTPLSLGLGMWAAWLINLTVAEVFILRRTRGTNSSAVLG